MRPGWANERPNACQAPTQSSYTFAVGICGTERPFVLPDTGCDWLQVVGKLCLITRVLVLPSARRAMDEDRLPHIERDRLQRIRRNQEAMKQLGVRF
jgi:hypothetical protein